MVLDGYRYTPEIKDGNKTLHLVSNPLKKTDKEKSSSLESELVPFSGKFQINKEFFEMFYISNIQINLLENWIYVFSGKYFCNAWNRGGSRSVYTEVVMEKPENDKKIIWAGASITAIVVIALAAFVAFYCYHK